jgi:hypothetical protein
MNEKNEERREMKKIIYRVFGDDDTLNRSNFIHVFFLLFKPLSFEKLKLFWYFALGKIHQQRNFYHIKSIIFLSQSSLIIISLWDMIKDFQFVRVMNVRKFPKYEHHLLFPLQ